MKILILSPFINASHEVVTFLQKKGIAVLCSAEAKEGWQMAQAHSASLDLIVVHREDARGQGHPGIDWVQTLKKHAVLQNIPFILSTAVWSDAQCVEHQGSAEGANAYIHWPFDANALFLLINEILGSAQQPVAAPSAGGYALESADVIFGQPSDSKGTMSIVLEAPDLAGMAPSGDFEKPEEDAATKVLQDMLMPALDEPVAAESLTPPPVPLEQKNTVETLSAAEAADEGAQQQGSGAGGGDGIAISLDAVAGLENAQIETSQHPAGEGVAATPESPPLDLDAPIQVPEGAAFDPSLLQVGEAGLAAAFESPSLDAPVLETVADSPSSSSIHPTIPEIQSAVSGNTGQTAAAESSSAVDPQAAAEMPYLYGDVGLPLEAGFPVAVDDAVVPGGAAQSPDVETLKKYLLLRENDVASLSAQLRAAKEQIKNLEDSVKVEKARAAELTHWVAEQKKKSDDFEKQKSADFESYQREIEELKFQLKAKTDKSKVMERQVQDAIEDLEKVKDRVRVDIRKIRVREKELENRLEIMKRDSEVLLSTREGKIIELKRKVDLLEFNMDLLQDQLSKEKENSARLRDKLTRASQAVRLAGGLLDSSGNVVFDIQSGGGGVAGGDVTASIPGTSSVAADSVQAATVVMDSTEVTKRAS